MIGPRPTRQSNRGTRVVGSKIDPARTGPSQVFLEAPGKWESVETAGERLLRTYVESCTQPSKIRPANPPTILVIGNPPMAVTLNQKSEGASASLYGHATSMAFYRLRSINRDRACIAYVTQRASSK